MADQAEKLRELVLEVKDKDTLGPFLGIKVEKPALTHPSRTIAITSGKGGVGKTNITVNLAIALSQHKKEVLILDADMGMANVDVLLGMNPKFNLQHVIMGGKSIEEVMIAGPENIKIIPGATGIQKLADLDKKRRQDFLQKISPLENLFDVVLVDTGAGISQSVLSFVLSSSEIIVITTPEPPAIMNAHSIIKVILQKNNEADIKLIVNMAETEDIAKKTLEKITTVCRQFLNTSIEPLGYILYDKSISRSVSSQKPFILNYPYAVSSKNIMDIAKKLLNLQPAKTEHGIINFFKKIGRWGR